MAFAGARQLAPTTREAAAPPASPTRPPPHPLPVTSIAWRTAHPAACAEVYRNWTFEDRGPACLSSRHQVPQTHPTSGSTRPRTATRGRSTGSTKSARRAAPGPLRPHLPGRPLNLGIAVEHIHHGAEIGPLRDLRKATRACNRRRSRTNPRVPRTTRVNGASQVAKGTASGRCAVVYRRDLGVRGCAHARGLMPDPAVSPGVIGVWWP
jgi:hypothetical protein